MNLPATIANLLWGLTNVPAYLRFRRALEQPAAVQRARLRTYLERNRRTEFGRAHDFAAIRTYEQFAQRVPLTDYDRVRPWIDRVQGGETNLLTAETVTHLVPTSGSTSGRKLIPFTRGLQREFNAGIGPWLLDLGRQMPGLAAGPAYWSVTPARREPDPETSSVPIGFDADTAYLGGTRKRLVDAVMVVPSAVQRAASLDAFRYATLLALLRCRELRLISVWHPSFLSLLLDALPSHWNDLLEDLGRGGCRCSAGFPQPVRREFNFGPRPKRAHELSRRDPLRPGTLWPRLGLISCWGDGAAGLSLGELRRRFPDVRFQAKGLLATEALVTVPFNAQQPLAIASHFFEFIDENGRIHLADGLVEGCEYEVVVTTAGGLWRYRLGDRVAVNGRVGQTPSLQFLGRGVQVSDRFGEKLSDEFVSAVLRNLFQDDPPRFVLLAPDDDLAGCRYTLYLEGVPRSGMAQELECGLRRNPHYDYCQQLGQLRPAGVFLIEADGYQCFAERTASRAARLGDVKPAALSQLSGWSRVFRGVYQEDRGISNPQPLRDS